MKNLNTNALENLKLDLENHVLIVTMNRPKALNALNNQTLAAEVIWNTAWKFRRKRLARLIRNWWRNFSLPLCEMQS